MLRGFFGNLILPFLLECSAEIILTGNRSVEINKYKFNNCSVPLDRVRLQTNNINFSLRLTNELRTIFALELVLVLKMIKERTRTPELQVNCF